MIDPFNSQSKGVRVPSMHKSDTYTHCQSETFSFTTSGYNPLGKAVIIVNFGAIRPNPILLVQDPLGELDRLDAIAPFTKTIRQWGPNGNESMQKTLGLWGGKVPGKKFYDFGSTPVKSLFSQVDQRLASRIRLVAGGLRIFKTSTAISESGTIRAAMKPRGGAP